jgi:hypothetical protein
MGKNARFNPDLPRGPRCGTFLQAHERARFTRNGSNPPDPLSKAQQTWAIESCMSWIKSLVRRMP